MIGRGHGLNIRRRHAWSAKNTAMAASRTGSWGLLYPPLPWQPIDSPHWEQTPSVPPPSALEEGFVWLVRQNMPHAKAAPPDRLTLGKQIGHQTNRVTKELLINQERDKFLRVDSLVSRALAFSPTLARPQSPRNGDAGVFTSSSLLMFCACHLTWTQELHSRRI